MIRAGCDTVLALGVLHGAREQDADPIHHGHGYGTPPVRCRPPGDPATEALARRSIENGFGLLARSDLAGFLRHASEARSDFRDVGPVLATLLRDSADTVTVRVLDVVLVDYSAVLGAPEPTWVAGALAVFAAGVASPPTAPIRSERAPQRL